MKRTIYQLLFVISVIFFLFSSFFTVAFAENIDGGTCGENLTWELDDSGTLTISGTGDMNISMYAPWYANCESINKVKLVEGITSVGNYAFRDCTNLKEIEIPKSVLSIGNYAFYGCKGLTSVSIPDSVTSIGSSAFEGCTGLINVDIPESVTSIGSSAFEGCTGLTSVTIPESVTSIGKYAFERCANLNTVYWNAINISSYPSTLHYFSYRNPFENAGTNGDGLTVIFGDGVESIPGHAFIDCTDLISVSIPESVTSIGGAAFYGCTGLTIVNIPEGVTNIEYSTFSGCTGLTDVMISSGVTSIGAGAFSGCTGLTSVNIPESVASIDYSAFRNCTGLTTVTIPDSVTIIGESAFYGCTGLTSVTIPKSVTIIGEGAFCGCTGLTSVTIPESVTSIGSSAFGGCTSLKNISVDDANSRYFSLDGVLFLHNSIISYPAGKTQSHYIIPDNVTSIGQYAFSGCTGLSNITIPDSFTEIGQSAFDGCTGLINITIPDSVTKIGQSAFNGCTGLNSIIIPNNVTSIGSSAFSGCTGLTGVIIPDGVTRIGDYTFYGCTGLTSITIPKGITSIGDEAFYGCTSLSTVYWNATNISGYYPSPSGSNYPYIPNPFGSTGTIGDGLTVIFGNGVESIPSYAFYGCAGLTGVRISDSVTSIGSSAFEGCTGLINVDIPKSVTSIESSAFYGCTGLTEVTLPDSVSSIGGHTFYGCENLESIYFSGTLQQWESIQIGNYNNSLIDATLYCLNGEQQPEFKISNNILISYLGDKVDLVIPDVVYGVEIKGIAENAFSGCSHIERITIPNTVTNIDADIFNDLINLKSITINEEHTRYSSLDGVLFNKDKTVLIAYPIAKQSDYVIPDTVTEIKADAFKNSTGLKSVTLHKNINKIEDYAFVDCLNLKYIYWNAENVQNNHPGVEDIYYPNVYFKNVGSLCGGCEVIFGDTVETIPQYTFYNCEGLKKVTISDSVNSIGYRAFQYCEDLESIDVSDNNIEFSSHDGVLYDKEATVLIQCPSGKNGNYIIPDSTVVIGENGFAGCDKLDSISVSDNIRIIGQWAFYDCKEGVKINWSSESLGDDEFHLNYGYAVTKDWFNKAIAISFGNRIETVPKNLFRGCTNISTVNIHLNIKEIGIRAFDNCNSITDVYYQGTTKQWESILINSDNLPILDAVIHCSDGIYEYEYTPSQKFEFSDGVIIGYLSNDSHVSIPETINGIKVIAIGENAFSDNTNLQGITIPDTVTSIGSYAFAGCTKLESVYLPDSVTDISDGAFAGCTALFEIELPDKITGIKTRLFANCKALKKIVIPKSVTTIYTYAFYGCEKLEKIVMSDDVTYIQDSAFENCSELTSIVLSKKLRSIGTSAFFGCTGLTSVIIPESVSEIKREAFYGCEKLKSVAIPENIISIGENAFGKCAGLEDVYFKGTLEKWNMIYSIDSRNDNLLNAELHCCAEILEPPIMYLSKTRIAASGITGTCKLILASYRGSNMLDLKITPISENTTFSISETGIKTTGATLIKLYLWKGTDTINPVCSEESTPF